MSTDWKKDSSAVLRLVLCAFTLAFYIGALLAPDLPEIFSGLGRIVTLPAQLTKDYFKPELGSISGTMLNAGLVGTVCCLLMFLPEAKVTGATVIAYFLTTGFCSYGMNILNILPLMFGVFVYSLIKGQSFGKNANFAMFATAVSPLISEVLFRYPTGEVHGVTPLGIVLAILIGIIVGCSMPALCAHAPAFHKGYDLYNAGPAAGFLCFMIFAVMHKALGIDSPAIGADLGSGDWAFVNIFCIVCFALCIVAGFVLNGNSFKGYGKLFMDSGYKVDFAAKYGIGPCVINIGVYGLFILAYYNLIGATFTGPTMGAVFCMLACCAIGATPLNVLPIMIGYFIGSRFGASAINAQAIIVGLCFASGLAPISGEYGPIAGIIAGLLHYCIVTSVPAIHGGFNLYNGGFTAGLVCFVFIPILESYAKTRTQRKAAK
ncbi:MAG: DUF1576 domain-containing protein [Clostridia bacterium]|nr:DUF1576 domain-containing protein [Clostridia bacterium]